MPASWAKHLAQIKIAQVTQDTNEMVKLRIESLTSHQRRAARLNQRDGDGTTGEAGQTKSHGSTSGAA